MQRWSQVNHLEGRHAQFQRLLRRIALCMLFSFRGTLKLSRLCAYSSLICWWEGYSSILSSIPFQSSISNSGHNSLMIIFRICFLLLLLPLPLVHHQLSFPLYIDSTILSFTSALTACTDNRRLPLCSASDLQRRAEATTCILNKICFVLHLKSIELWKSSNQASTYTCLSRDSKSRSDHPKYSLYEMIGQSRITLLSSSSSWI